jgi:hypothetical protein
VSGRDKTVDALDVDQLEQKRLRNYGPDSARSEQAGQRSDAMDEKNDHIAHRRIVAGREILRNYRRNNNSPATASHQCFRGRRPVSAGCDTLPMFDVLECRRLRCWLHIFDLSALEMGESVPDDTQRCDQRH